MQLEVEQKFHAPDLEAVRGRVVELGGAPLKTVEQRDTYFRHPSRDFAQTGEALRIRRTGDQAVVTYKGAKLDREVKTRPELEFPLFDGGDPQQELFGLLGFVQVADVAKHREAYQLTRGGLQLEVALDTVADVGTFAEVEAIAEQDAVAAAQAAVQQLAADLGLTDLEPRSYLRMYLEGRDA
ncbi:CYTH domain protein [Posidoniimonas polymericola]|uniref:CYTH domain protein n=1 Tax=Posidoniimonas polymericola TaxID=2528002 RepID=A0A5C5YSV4_9BACT|nr:class IV adenylate cyclase [Posidoniimonas polymericola]TWT77727.1 CYTH domain protein [Posidoniimonas polymericola]